MSVQSFVEELYAVPESVGTRIFGAVQEIEMPTTEAAAMIAVGKLSANLNNAFLVPLSGMDLTELLLRVGQRSSTSISALLSGLEVIAGAGGRLTIISPAEGADIGLSAQFSCSGEGLTGVVVTIAGQMEFDLELQGDIWSGILPDALAGGTYTAVFVGTFGDGATAEASVSFAIVEADIIVDSVPAPDTSYEPDDLAQARVTLKDGIEASSVSISMGGVSLDMEKTTGNTYAADLLNASFLGVAGVYIADISVVTSDGTIKKSFEFSLFLGDEPGEG